MIKKFKAEKIMTLHIFFDHLMNFTPHLLIDVLILSSVDITITQVIRDKGNAAKKMKANDY